MPHVNWLPLEQRKMHFSALHALLSLLAVSGYWSVSSSIVRPEVERASVLITVIVDMFYQCLVIIGIFLPISSYGIVCSDDMCSCNKRSWSCRGYTTVCHKLAVEGHAEWGT